MRHKRILVLAIVLTWPLLAWGQAKDPPAPADSPPGATAACAKSEEGAQCSMMSARGVQSGHCRKVGDRLTCVLDAAPPPAKK